MALVVNMVNLSILQPDMKICIIEHLIPVYCMLGIINILIKRLEMVWLITFGNQILRYRELRFIRITVF